MIIVAFSLHHLNGPVTTKPSEVFAALFDPLFLRYGHLDRSSGFGWFCLAWSSGGKPLGGLCECVAM